MKSILCLLAGLSLLTINATAAPSGAIFTTLPDGSKVNANIYTNKLDVYLDGGPGPNAPAKAAGLPEGDYYFQVTDPSGQVLLSEDPVNCRTFHVNADGVIDAQNGTHAIGTEIDHPELGAITVQLMPYSDTPNPGGVYKVWITPIDQFVGDTALVDNETGFHGFIPAWCKTDNFKVLTSEVPPPPNEYLGILYVDKFFDINNNGIWEKDTEPHIGEWPFSIVDNLGVTNNYYTPAAEAFRTDFQYGEPTYRVVTEDMVDGWFQTALSVDDTAILPPSQTVTVDYPAPDDLLTPVTHVVVFGNAICGEVVGQKFYDKDVDGVLDDGEPPVEGVLFTLTGMDILANNVSLTGYTGADGFVRFENLVPGTYTLTETLDGDWFPTTPASSGSFTVSGGETVTHLFGNCLYGEVVGQKFYDRDADGVLDDGEPPVEGILFTLTGVDALANSVNLTGYTGADGFVRFEDLVPGTYTLAETVPGGTWFATTPVSIDNFVLTAGSTMQYVFGNACRGGAAFGTKGYWHNKNGLKESTLADFAFLNSLLPWMAPSAYFGNGDEPIDGKFANGKPVPAATEKKVILALAGTAFAEQSNFLVDANANGDPREQLAQQLNAFIMNTRHRLEGDVVILLPDGITWKPASGIIADAVSIWATGSAAARTAMKTLLDNYNNSGAVQYVHAEPCTVAYPVVAPVAP
jgi:hypothetical protein